jgi:hypothetical protein
MPIPGEAPRKNPKGDIDRLTRSNQAMKRFLESMEMNYEKWHDGIGYDLDALDEMTQEDKDSIVNMLITNLDEPWRTFEALERIDTQRTRATINNALDHPSLKVRIAASRFAKGADTARERVLVEAIEKSELYAGLTQALNEVETFHPKRIVDALLRGLLKRGDSGAVNFAGMLLYIHGKADTPFDWDKRSLFLRFNTADLKERKNAFVDLCKIIGVDSEPYLMEHRD